MTITARVKGTESPAAALIVIAELLDDAFSRIEELESDAAVSDESWASWGSLEEAAYDGPTEEWAPRDGILDDIREVERELQGCSDAEESQVLRAKLMLLQDELKPPIEMQDNTGKHTEIEVELDGTVVHLPPASEEHQELRRKFATDVLRLTEVYGEDDGAKYVESYAKAGPLLLYYSDRDFVMGLPDDYKRAMVRDVSDASPKEAHEMGRDVLKDKEPGGPEISVENLVRTMSD
jgi:hypothetical protein